jgi:16S rRNA (uracil1498-N3)-methyltransferase
MQVRRFYAAPGFLAGNKVELGSDETRHLRDVLRLREGAAVRVFDGLGREFECSVAAIGKRSAELSVMREVEPSAPESPLGLTLAAAVLKGDRFDLVVQKAVELGVARLVPVAAARCDVRTGDIAKRAERWRKIALEAAKQCGRARLMEIAPAASPEAVLGDGSCVFFSEREGLPIASVQPGTGMTAVVGPEGGWEDSEIDAARRSGAAVITLGGRILRAETAAVAVTAILQSRFGDLN